MKKVTSTSKSNSSKCRQQLVCLPHRILQQGVHLDHRVVKNNNSSWLVNFLLENRCWSMIWRTLRRSNLSNSFQKRADWALSHPQLSRRFKNRSLTNKVALTMKKPIKSFCPSSYPCRVAKVVLAGQPQGLVSWRRARNSSRTIRRSLLRSGALVTRRNLLHKATTETQILTLMRSNSRYTLGFAQEIMGEKAKSQRCRPKTTKLILKWHKEMIILRAIILRNLSCAIAAL